MAEIYVKEIWDGEGRELTKEYVDDDGEVIPVGWKWDGNSAPRFAYRIVQPFKHLTHSCRHDWDCYKARQLMKQAREFADNGLIGTARIYRIRAKKLRLAADRRYRDRKIKREGKVIGWLAYGGIRFGSFFGSGWKKSKRREASYAT